MKINSINSLNTYNKAYTPSFKHTAVPYPEYESGYKPKPISNKSKIIGFVDKLSDLFKPEVTEEAKNIKSNIDRICDDGSPKQHLLSVVA